MEWQDECKITSYPFWNYRKSPYETYGSIDHWPLCEIKNIIMMHEIFPSQTVAECLAELTRRRLIEKE